MDIQNPTRYPPTVQRDHHKASYRSIFLRYQHILNTAEGSLSRDVSFFLNSGPVQTPYGYNP